MSGRGAALLARMLSRGRLTPRRAAVIIATFTTLITLLGGAVARLLDAADFHSFGDAFWWALQTVTTVGYGDVVPKSALGRTIAGLLMVTGIAFLSVITASVTAALVESTRKRRRPQPDMITPELADEILTRLTAIENRLPDPPADR